MNCDNCTVQEQALRNCSGKGKPARIILNNELYSRCPKAMYLEALEARALYRVYNAYRKTNAYPAVGTMLDQTAFTLELFDYLDEIFASHEIKNRKSQ